MKENHYILTKNQNNLSRNRHLQSEAELAEKVFIIVSNFKISFEKLPLLFKMVYTMAYNGMNLANEFWRHSFQPIKMDTLKCYLREFRKRLLLHLVAVQNDLPYSSTLNIEKKIVVLSSLKFLQQTNLQLSN